MRVLAFEVLSELGIGSALVTAPGLGVTTSSEILASLRAMLDSDLRAHFGISLRQARYRWRGLLGQSHLRREVRLGIERATSTDILVEARELGRVGRGKRIAVGS